MASIFNFDDYKLYLIDYHVWKYDEDKYEDRVNYINSRYSDEYLRDIINNTQNFISSLLSEMSNEHKIYEGTIFNKIELPQDRTEYISNGCGGGWPADKLFCTDDKESLISMYLVKNFFGSKFQIELYEDERDSFNAKENVGCIYSVPTFSISGPLTEFDRIYNNKIEEERGKLVLVLKKAANKKQTIN